VRVVEEYECVIPLSDCKVIKLRQLMEGII
jgi:hypothetical protein